MKKLILSLFILFLTSAPALADSAYERIQQSGKIRCGYINYYPSFIKDPNTDEFSGIFYEITEEMGNKLNLEIEWAVETTFGTMIEDVRAGRFDVVCANIWPSAERARLAAFTNAVFYSAVEAYVRPDDKRFDGNVRAINSPDVTIATLDGEMSSTIAKNDFPKSKTVSLPNITDISQLLLNVSTGKADVTFVETSVANDFLSKNPSALKKVENVKPVRVFSNGFLVKGDEVSLVHMLNTAQQELLHNGFIDRILDKYQKSPDDFYRVGKPYEAPN